MRWLREAYARNPLLTGVAAAHLALLLLLAPAAALDPTEILGISRWIKPMKFAISIAIFTATMAWLLGYLRDSDRAVRRISWTIAATMIGEQVLITMQAARGVRSHFNADSAFNGIVFSVMGAMITINTIASAYALYLFLRRRTAVTGAALAGIRLGLRSSSWPAWKASMVGRARTRGLSTTARRALRELSTVAGDRHRTSGMQAGAPLLGFWLHRTGRATSRPVAQVLRGARRPAMIEMRSAIR